MEIQWKSSRGTISFPVVMNLRCFFSKSYLRISMPKPRESPSKDSEPKTDATEPQTEPSKKRSSIAILDGEEIEEF